MQMHLFVKVEPILIIVGGAVRMTKPVYGLKGGWLLAGDAVYNRA